MHRSMTKLDALKKSTAVDFHSSSSAAAACVRAVAPDCPGVCHGIPSARCERVIVRWCTLIIPSPIVPDTLVRVFDRPKSPALRRPTLACPEHVENDFGASSSGRPHEVNR